MSPDQIIIRKFQEKDRARVRQIGCDTGLMGESCGAFFEGEEIFADAISLYFTDYEPQSCLVAEFKHNVIGYLIGSKDTAVLDEVFKEKIFFSVFLKALKQGIFCNQKNARFFFRSGLSLLKGEFNMPNFSKDYPAVLHINIEKEFRALGTGGRLISAFLDYLRQDKVKGVRLVTMSEKAGQFFLKQGFKLLFEGKRSYLRHVLHRDISIAVYGLKFA